MNTSLGAGRQDTAQDAAAPDSAAQGAAVPDSAVPVEVSRHQRQAELVAALTEVLRGRVEGQHAASIPG